MEHHGNAGTERDTSIESDAEHLTSPTLLSVSAGARVLGTAVPVGLLWVAVRWALGMPA